jgi:putative DNA primase/helicase
MHQPAINSGKTPAELKKLPHWVAHRPDKTPVNPKTGGNAQADNPATWGTFAQAVKHCEAHKGNGIVGIGYEFSYYDPFCGIDLDHCRNPETGEIEAWAWEIISRFNSYSEVSPSETGVHIIIKAKLPKGAEDHQKNLDGGGKIEVYDVGRYFTVTGNHLEGTPPTIQDRNKELKAFHAQVIAKPKTPPKPASPSATLSMADSEIIDKAKAAQNGNKFDRLMSGDTREHGGDDSRADLALCALLAFWTQDPGQIDRIFRTSALSRDKWDRPTSGSTYGAKTIAKALSETRETYQGTRYKDNGKMKAAAKPFLKVVSKAPFSAKSLRFHLTDIGNGQRLVSRHGHDLRYCYPWGKWLIYDGQRWAKDSTGEVDRRAKDTVRSMYAEAAQIEEKALREALADHARKSESDAKRQAMISSAKSEQDVPIMPDDLDRDPWQLNLLNGTVDLRAIKLRPHRPKDLISKLAPVSFNPGAECPAWWKFLERVFDQDFDLIHFIQKTVGYALTGITREQCLFFLYGLGANGKSTFLEVIQTMLGDYANQTTSETFMVKRQGGQISNDVADLRGARFVSAAEIESGRRMAEVLVKQMTGGDKLKARFLYSEYFEFKPEFKIFLAANHKPVIRGTDNAIWRRIHLIPFTVQIPRGEQDRELSEKLKTELPGILNWAIEGCVNWQEKGLTPPQAVQEATQKYREEMDILNDWIFESCVLAPGATAMATDLYKSYSSWAEEAGEKRPLSQTAFGIKLTERGFHSNRGAGGKTIREGIGLKIE